MGSLSPMENRAPHYKVEVFNLWYSWYNAGYNLIAGANPYKSGWYEVPQDESNGQKIVGMETLTIKDDITKTSIAEFKVLSDEVWMYTCDMLTRRMPSVESPFSGSKIIQNPEDSKLIVYIDTDGYGSPDTVGTIDIVGELDSGAVSETITINGEGSYISTYVYDTLTSVTANNLTCHISVFGHVNTANVKHEVKIWCDTNGDGKYGLMFGGYLLPNQSKVINDDDTILIKCHDYTSFMIENEYIAGYRTNFRCSRYSNTGDYGDCSYKVTGTYAPDHWHTTAPSVTPAAHRCYIGDLDKHHPSGATVASIYTCGDYSASTDFLPYDRYTYDPNYVPDGVSGKSYYPEDYTRAMFALRNMTRSIDKGKALSRYFDLHMKGYALVNETGGITDSDTGITYDGYLGTIAINDFIKIEDEFMLVSSNTGGILTVTRGSLGSTAVAHADNSSIKCYSIANTTYGSNSHDFLIEADIGGTIYDTGNDLAEILTSRSTNSLYQFWVDAYRQIHMTEMYRTDTGHTTSLTFTHDDIKHVSQIKLGEVVNKVSAWVETESNGKFYCELTSDSLTAIDGSIPEFGLRSKEVKNDQLNVIGYDDAANNKFGFLTFAEAYLKIHAYPKITQTLVVDSFVPDEHYWTNTYDPLLDYNDPFNSYICLLGTRVTAPDYSIEGHPNKTFIIEALEYDIKEFGNFDTYVRMSRLSKEDDYK